MALASVPVIGLKLVVGLGLLLTYAYSIHFLGLLWLLGTACDGFVLILFNEDGPQAES